MLCKKALTHENLSSALQITFHEKEASFIYLSFIHKIALSNFLSLRKKLFSIRGLARALLLKLHFMYLSFIHKIALSNFLSLRKKLFSIRGRARALLLKLHLETFFHWERSFSASMALHSLNLLSCTKHSISVLGSSKLLILCIEALTWLALQKSSNIWKPVFCIANNISFHKKETSLMYLSFIHKIAFCNFLSLRKKFFSIRGLAFSSFA